MAIFMNPKSAELELENLETTSSHRLLPFGTESAAEDGIRRDTTPSRTAHFKRNSATSSSRYENVAISVPSTPSLSPPSNTTELGTKQSERRNSSESSQMMRNLSIRASLRSTSNSARKQRKDDSSTNSFFAKLQLFYEHSPLRHFAPFLLLIAYALLGALLFFVLESENERQLLANEQRQLEVLRGQTIQKIEGNLKTTIRERWSKSKKIMLDFERDFMRLKVPEGTLEWNYLGALFYVGTVFTTIGYGNITPRTSPGQALSILYAIVGIPLVLAILNQTSKKMTKWLSEKWICYHKRIKAKRHKTRRGDERVMEEGNGGVRTADNEGTDKETMESRTIPVWMALSIVSGYMCTIAAIFLIWESRWSYFTSFYFICISCLTIGLGDVVPDHPQMLILMFVFVIFGLSFVSMLLSVIQIKMEEWLYKMMIQMQKEYQKALREVSDPIERDRIIAALYAREPWYMRQLAPLCVSETQKEKLENLTQSYEKVTKEANTRGTQTENWGEEEEKGETKQKHGTEQEENGGPKSMRVAKTDEEYISARAELSNSSRSLSRSISDATSLPMDPASISPRHLCSKEVQTELSGNIIEKMERDREREEKEKEEERIKEREREEKDKEEERIKEREREQKERERLKEKEKAPKTKTQSKAVDTGSDFVVSKEHRGTQLKAATSNKRTDTKGLIRTEDRAADTAQLIRKSVAKAVQTEEKRQQQRTVQTMFPSKEEEEEQSPMLKVDQRRRLFSLTGRKDEFEEEAEVTTDAWAQCSPPPELCDFGVQTLPLFGDFEVDETVEQLFEDDDEMSNDGSEQKEQRSESVAVTIGDEWLDMAYPKRTEKKDLVIQTDDSYLRIARRLDKLRTNRTDLNVYCTATNPPLRRKADGKRKSLRFLDPFRPRRRSKTPENEEKRAGEEADKCRVDAGTSPERPTPKRGRVAQLVATHEQSKPIQRDRAAPSPSAMASVAGRARKNIRHVRMAEDVRGNSDDEGEKAVGSR